MGKLFTQLSFFSSTIFTPSLSLFSSEDLLPKTLWCYFIELILKLDTNTNITLFLRPQHHHFSLDATINKYTKVHFKIVIPVTSFSFIIPFYISCVKVGSLAAVKAYNLIVRRQVLST